MKGDSMPNISVEKSLYDQLMESATRIGQTAEGEALEADRNSNISENTIDVMREEEIHRLLLPKEYGYPQIDFSTYIDFIRKMSYYNLSAAWVASLFSLHNGWVAYLPKRLRDEVVSQAGFVADVFAPVGKVEPCEGGYLLSGKWNFSSGISYSDWVGLGAFMEFDDREGRELVGICVNVSDVTIQ